MCKKNSFQSLRDDEYETIARRQERTGDRQAAGCQAHPNVALQDGCVDQGAASNGLAVSP
jgi:hypothetical protein